MQWLVVGAIVACCRLMDAHAKGSLSPTMKLFEWNELLMATNGSFMWHAVQSGSTPDSSVIEFKLVGPYPMFDKANNQSVKIDFALIASSGSTNCTVLVLVEPNLHYRSWKVNAPTVTRWAELELHEQLFKLVPYAGKERCEMNIWEEEGQLQQIHLLAPLLGNSSRVGSIFTRHNHTRLYILATKGAISIDLESQPEQVERLLWDYNLTDKETNIMLYRELYAIQNIDQSSHICRGNFTFGLDLFKVGNICSQIQFKFVDPHGQHILAGLRSIDENETSIPEIPEKPPAKMEDMMQFIILVVVVAISVTIMMSIYLVVVNRHCNDTVATIQMTGLNPKFIASLESVDSIKTLDSEKLDVPQGPSQTPTPKKP